MYLNIFINMVQYTRVKMMKSKLIKNFINDERGDSEIIDTSIALIFIMGLFIAFVVYSNSARTKIVMNYSAKEGARMYAISKDAGEGIDTANSYLDIGGVKSANVSTSGDSGIKIQSDLNVHVPFFNSGDSIKLVSEFVFFEEFDSKYYNKGNLGDGWLKVPFVTTREYKDDSNLR